jgi:hypothetical protein
MNGVRWLIFASEALALEAALIGMTGTAIIVILKGVADSDFSCGMNSASIPCSCKDAYFCKKTKVTTWTEDCFPLIQNVLRNDPLDSLTINAQGLFNACRFSKLALILCRYTS